MTALSLRSLSTFVVLAAALATHSLTAVAQPAGTLQKTALPIDGNGNGYFEIDETVQYTLVFTNSGLVDLTGVVVLDPSSACIRLDGGSVVIEPTTGGTSASGSDIQVDLQSPLPPGESVTITFVGSATDVGSCCNQATWTSVEVAGGVSDRDLLNATPDEPSCHVASAVPGPDTDAIIDKQVLSAGCHAPGSTIEFRVRAQNTGSRPLRNGFFEDFLNARFVNVVVDAGLNYDAATGRIYTDPKTWGVGEESNWTYRAELPCTETGTLTNTALFRFEDNGGIAYTRSDRETVEWGRPNLVSSTKQWHEDLTDGDGFVSPGETVTFTITVRNTGLCEALNITVSDALDARLVETAPILAVQDGGFYDPATQTIEWTAATTPQLAALQPGSEIVLTFTTQVEPGTPDMYIPNTATISVLGNDSAACPLLTTLTRSLTLQNGDVRVGAIAPQTILLRNDFVSCLEDAFRVVDGGYPWGSAPPVLQVRPAPQECSDPSAINAAHSETDTHIDPISPYTFVNDGVWRSPNCPQTAFGTGGKLVFYEIADDCTTSLRVTKDPTNRTDVLVSW